MNSNASPFVTTNDIVSVIFPIFQLYTVNVYIKEHFMKETVRLCPEFA